MHWNTIVKPIETQVNIQRSRFIAYIAPVDNPEQAARIVSLRSAQFADATHNCYAWVTGWERENSYYADAGEPSGTAGKPILNALLSAGLTNVVAIVTRYFGGVKLGVRGLIEAYGSSTQAAISEAAILPAIAMTELSVTCDYADFQFIQNMVQKLEGKIVQTEYKEDVQTLITLPQEALEQLKDFLDGRSHQSGLRYQIKE